MPPIENNQMNQNSENSAGPVIAIIIVLAVIILGGLYFWGARDSVSELDEANIEETVEAIGEQSSSDDLNSIEADLDDTSVEDLGSDLESI